MTGAGFQFQGDRDLKAGLLRRVTDLEIENADSQPWTPAIITSGPALSYDTSRLQGSFIRRGNWVFARWAIILSGYSGAVGGGWALRTPWPPSILSNMNQVVGSWWAQHAGSYLDGTLLSVSNTGLSADHWIMTHSYGSNSASFVNATVPLTWADGDGISGMLSYEVMPGY